MSADDKFNVFYMLLLLVFLGSGLIVHLKNRPKLVLGNMTIWFLLIVFIVGVYSYRENFANLKDRVLAELNPSSGRISDDGYVEFSLSMDGHFHINAQVNRQNIEFLFDTGASDISLTLSDAKKIGIDIDALDFNKVYNTANGQVYGAPVRLNVVKVGTISVYNVRASVNKGAMTKSLLGMSFLNEIGGYEVRGSKLRLWSD